MALSKKYISSIVALKDPPIESPGPGAYEPFISEFSTPSRRASPRGRGGVINPITVVQAVSPGRAAAAASNPSLQKMSVPSIPSRFLTPIIDGTQTDNDGGDICKMSRLVDDPSKVGPGSYQVQDEYTKRSPSGSINWQHSLTKRSGISPSNRTQETVGPGSYNSDVKFYKPMAPFFAR